MRTRYCKHIGCIEAAEEENYVKDTPLCLKHRTALQQFIVANTTQRWAKLAHVLNGATPLQS